MPTYGCFRMPTSEPDRTWTADYVVSKGDDRIEFWNRASAQSQSDVLVGMVRLGREQTICDVSATCTPEPKEPNFYRAIFDGKEQQEPAPILGK
jgi:hypothetical protein